MIKTNQEFAFVLARRAARDNSRSAFRRVDALEVVPKWIERIELIVDERPLVLAGTGENPEYCVTDSAVWRGRAGQEPERLFHLDAVAAAHWMRRHLWQELERAPTAEREEWVREVKTRERENVHVELDSGDCVLLEGAGDWLLRFLQRCASYKAKRWSKERADENARGEGA
jgi:hypothetical protein